MGPSLHLRRMEGEKIDLLLGGLQVSVYMYIVHHYALTIQQYCSYDHQMHQVTLKSFADPIHIVVAMIFHHVLDVLTGSKTQDLSLLVKERSLLLRSKCHQDALTIQQYCSYDHQMHQVTLKSFADPIHIVVAMIFHHVLDVLTGSKTQDLSLLVKERSLLLRSKCHQVPVKQWKSRSKKCKNIIGLDLQLESVCQLVSTG